MGIYGWLLHERAVVHCVEGSNEVICYQPYREPCRESGADSEWVENKLIHGVGLTYNSMNIMKWVDKISLKV